MLDRTITDVSVELQVRILSNDAEFVDLSSEWNSLLSVSHHARHYFSHEWFHAWWSAFGTSPSDNLNILLVEDEGKLIGIAPLMTSRQSGGLVRGTVLQFMANSHSPRADFIIHREHDPRSVVRCILDECYAMRRWTHVWLRNMPKNVDFSPGFANLTHLLDERAACYSVESNTESPYFDLDGDFDTYFARLDGHFRRNLRRRARNVEKQGEVVYNRIDLLHDNYKDVLEEGLDLELNGWKGKNGTAIKSNPAVHQFYKNLCENFRSSGELVFHTLRLDDKMLAFDFCFLDDEVFYLTKIAYNESFRKFSPGNLLKLKQIQFCHESGFREYDFLGVSAPWKLSWADKMRHQADILIYNRTTIRGLLLYFKNVLLLPRLRNIAFLRKIKNRIGE